MCLCVDVVASWANSMLSAGGAGVPEQRPGDVHGGVLRLSAGPACACAHRGASHSEGNASHPPWLSLFFSICSSLIYSTRNVWEIHLDLMN